MDRDELYRRIGELVCEDETADDFDDHAKTMAISGLYGWAETMHDIAKLLREA